MQQDGAYPERHPRIFIPDDEHVPVVDMRTGRMFDVDEVGRVILEHANGSQSVDSLVATVISLFDGASEPEVRADVEAFIKDSVAGGLLIWRPAHT